MVTEQGYVKRTYQEILDDKIRRAKELFGDDIDTRDITPLGKYIRINAYDQAEIEETAERLYFSLYPHTATGINLDRLCATVGISRNPATASRYIVNVVGTEGETVPIGFLVGTEAGVQFYCVSDSTIGEDGTCSMVVECTEAGTMGNVTAKDITVVVNPDANISSVLGDSCISVATDEETDVSLRNRYDQALNGAGSCSKAAIEGALLKIETVKSACVVANEESETVSGRPPHSIECYVQGGEEKHQEIAETILEKKAFGIKTHGTESVTLEQGNGETYTVYFSHTENIDILISIKIRTNVNYNGESSKQEIVNNVLSAINGLGVGNSVILSSLYTQIYSVTGIAEVTELKQSTDNGSTYTAKNIAITAYQTANCVGVSVEVVE